MVADHSNHSLAASLFETTAICTPLLLATFSKNLLSPPTGDTIATLNACFQNRAQCSPSTIMSRTGMVPVTPVTSRSTLWLARLSLLFLLDRKGRVNQPDCMGPQLLLTGRSLPPQSALPNAYSPFYLIALFLAGPAPELTYRRRSAGRFHAEHSLSLSAARKMRSKSTSRSRSTLALWTACKSPLRASASSCRADS